MKLLVFLTVSTNAFYLPLGNLFGARQQAPVQTYPTQRYPAQPYPAQRPVQAYPVQSYPAQGYAAAASQPVAAAQPAMNSNLVAKAIQDKVKNLSPYEKAKLQNDSAKMAEMVSEIRKECMGGGITGDGFDAYGMEQLPALRDCIQMFKERYGFYNPQEERSKALNNLMSIELGTDIKPEVKQETANLIQQTPNMYNNPIYQPPSAYGYVHSNTVSNQYVQRPFNGIFGRK